MADWHPSCTLDVLAERADMLATIRSFFATREIMEVQTAALAAHGVTDPAIESMRTADGRYLQTSPEYQMKRLLAAGAPSIYQIGPVFRAGEAGRWHNPEFTMIEWYRVGLDAEALMGEVAELVDALLGPSDYDRRGYAGLVGVPVDSTPEDELNLRISEAIAKLSPARVFVTEYPAPQAALARVEGGVASRFELVVDGLEVANGYHELRDADELRRRMVRDNALRRAEGLGEIPLDEAFLEAHAYGLPDCAGVAVGFDRLVALKLGVDSLAEVLPFPVERA
ncbi:MAG: EF-P lysine aminoacylase GenX [Gammaproteobacteria bacterium]|nr:EF-P lysine aminoacylase GenX [Gammaproteobacteria bacterium]